MTICDIPGLLEGAHLGKGLGRGFLRHIERCKMIIHVVNGDSIDPVGDYNAINRELKLFSKNLANKPQVVVLNKIDLLHVSKKQKEILNLLKKSMSHSRLLPISAAGQIGIKELIEKTWNFLNKIKYDAMKQQQQQHDDDNNDDASNNYIQHILLSDRNNIDSRIQSSNNNNNNVINQNNYDYHDNNHNYNDNMNTDVIAMKSFKINYLSYNKVSISGILINAMIDELSNVNSYYGSIDRFDALVDSIDLSNEIYKVIIINNNKRISGSSSASSSSSSNDNNSDNNRYDRNKIVSNARKNYNLVNRINHSIDHDDIDHDDIYHDDNDNNSHDRIVDQSNVEVRNIDYKNDEIKVIFKTSTNEEVLMNLKNHKFFIG